ncbi:MAG: alkaline phosphatase family protein [Kiritimatiellales bacterium]|nr:alkaline phosphatase family protein [Kiritimatiellota bacterium]MBL7011671.1 alkaline phosphatase family protein [Kiritimatiellales bacterium]
MKKEKLSLFLFIDAFGWEVRKRHPFFLNDRTCDQKKLETILGYSSACDPSIISGRLPQEHLMWSSFYYDPDGSPFKWTKALAILPDAIFRRGRVRHVLSKLIKKALGFTGYFQLYGVPFKTLPLFNYAEQKRIWEPNGLLRGETIFDELHRQGVPHYVHDSAVSDETKLARLTADIESQRIDLAYCSLGKLDALMHAVGTQDAKVTELVHWYDQQLEKLIQTAEEHYEEVVWYVFTDHGMHDITEGYNLIADIEQTGLIWNEDYVAFYDSTMARFWFLNETGKEKITAALTGHPKGKILSEDELKAEGVFFADGMYGELIFLIHSGIQIVPSFMGVKQIKGMHGYHPADADSAAAISSNRPLPAGLTKIHEIYHLMRKELGWSPCDPAIPEL